mmetsp:Transcript_143736/g.253886  ORF Transcript_143736/g.253886 Transcript_143736/m.253886 type:complete len:390 (+) Transcript_143736:63-1232(+)
MVCDSPTVAAAQSEETSQAVRKKIQNMIVELFARDETQDVLESHCAGDEIIAVMEQREELSKLGPDQDLGMPAGVRRVTAWLMAYLMTNLKLSDRAWFDAVTLMDDYSQRVGGGGNGVPAISFNEVPALCVAIVRLVKKIEDAEAPSQHDEYVYKEFIQYLAKWLQTLGYDVEGWENVSTNVQEQHVLMTTKLCLQTVESWLLVFCTRLNVVAQRAVMQKENVRWQDTINKLWQQGIGFARLVLLNRATNGELRPRRLAQGLLAIGLIISKLLPVQAMNFEVGSAEWEWFEAQTPPQSKEGEEQMIFMMHQHEFLLELMQVATGTDLDELIQDCWHILQVLSSLKLAVSHQQVSGLQRPEFIVSNDLNNKFSTEQVSGDEGLIFKGKSA